MDGPPDQPLFAFKYRRVSKVGERGEDLESPEIQDRHMEAYAAQYGITIVGEYEDLDQTGREFEKRSISEIIRRIKAGDGNAVLVFKWSRWGRNLALSQKYCGLVEDAGGVVLSTSEQMDTRTSFGKFARGLVQGMDQLQSDILGDSWKDAHQSRRVKMLPHSGRSRFGYVYTNVEGQTARYDIDLNTSEIVREAYDQYLIGTPINQIVRDWNARGLRTSPTKKRPNGERWSSTALMYMLDTGFAAGLIRERSEPQTPENRRLRSMKTFDIWRKGSHEPIIPMSTWERYKAKREQNALVAPRAKTATHRLSAMLECNLCSGRLTAIYDTNNHRQWACLKARRTKCHRPVMISDLIALAKVKEWLQQNSDNSEDLSDEARHCAQLRQLNADAIEQYRSDESRWEDRLSKLIDMRADGEITKVEYDKKRAKYSNNLAEAHQARVTAEVKFNRTPAIPEPDVFTTLLNAWDLLSPHRYRQALAEVISTIVVSPGPGKRQTVEEAMKRLRVVPRWET